MGAHLISAGVPQSFRLVIFVVVGSRGKGSCFQITSTTKFCRKRWYLELVFATQQGWRVRSCFLLHHRSVGNDEFLGSVRCSPAGPCLEVLLLCPFSLSSFLASFLCELHHSPELTKRPRHGHSLPRCAVLWD